MFSLFISLLPAFAVILLGYTTRRILPSLIIGILLASLIISESPFDAITLSLSKFLSTLEIGKVYNDGIEASWNLLICIFLLILGTSITFLHHSGAASAYKKFISSKLKTKKGAEVASLLMSTGLFVDDYFSSLTVGSVMQTVTDSFKIPRAKLAFLVDSMAAPLVMLCPASTWVVAIMGFMRDSGITRTQTSETLILGSPFAAYLSVIPYLFYSFVVIAGTWSIVLFGISFGKMAKHEKLAMETGNLFGGKPSPINIITSNEEETPASMFDFLILISALVLFILLGLAYSGSWVVFGGENSLVEAFRNSSAAKGLFFGGIAVLIFQTIYMLSRRLLKPSQIPSCIYQGIELMLPSILVLLLAWTLGDLLKNDLKTGQLIAQQLSNSISVSWLPFILFLVATLCSVCIGSSWGASAVMFPIAVQLYLSIEQVHSVITLEEASSLFPILGAVLSGAVAGDHISPISDTTIMTSTSTAMSHSDHVDTQLSYAIPFIFITALLFMIFGFIN